MDLQTLTVLGILFLSTFVRSAFGFGDALIAMPLLAMVVGIRTATPLVALVAGTIALAILVRNRRHVQVKSAWRLVVSSIAGIPVGLFFLKGGCEGTMKLILALIVILFSIHQLVRPGIVRLKSERPSWLFGFAAGALGGALNTNGPPVVVYGSMRQWPPATFRATLQGYFFTTGWFILLGHFLAGFWTRDLLALYAGSLTAALISTFVAIFPFRAGCPFSKTGSYSWKRPRTLRYRPIRAEVKSAMSAPAPHGVSSKASPDPIRQLKRIDLLRTESAMNILSNINAQTGINAQKPVLRVGLLNLLFAPALLAGLVLPGCGDDDPAAPQQKVGKNTPPPAKASAGIGERIRFKPSPERKKKDNRKFTFSNEKTAKDVTYDFDKLVYGHNSQNVVSKRKDGTEERLEVSESELPKGFPEEFPLYPGARIINSGKSVKSDGLAFMLNMKTQDNFFAVSNFYKNTLPGKGFTIGADLSPCNEKIMRIMAEKGENTSLSIAIYQDSSGTYVLANIMMKKPAPPPAGAEKEEPASGS